MALTYVQLYVKMHEQVCAGVGGLSHKFIWASLYTGGEAISLFIQQFVNWLGKLFVQWLCQCHQKAYFGQPAKTGHVGTNYIHNRTNIILCNIVH